MPLSKQAYPETHRLAQDLSQCVNVDKALKDMVLEVMGEYEHGSADRPGDVSTKQLRMVYQDLFACFDLMKKDVPLTGVAKFKRDFGPRLELLQRKMSKDVDVSCKAFMDLEALIVHLLEDVIEVYEDEYKNVDLEEE